MNMEIKNIDKKVIDILSKIYWYENSYYNSKLDRNEHKIPETVSAADIQQLERLGLKPNNFEAFEHDGMLKRLLSLKTNEKLTEEFAISLFYKGITGEFVRGRQTLMSYIYLKHLPEHSFQGKDHCEICGLPKKKTEDKTHTLYTYYLGHSWNESQEHFLIELEDIIRYEKPTITPSDKQCLSSLLEFIALADENETSGQLEKRIASAKLLKNTDKYKRYGILQTLAECGILPNDFIVPPYDSFLTLKERIEAGKNIKDSSRSDIVLPLAGWRGKNRVNFQKYKEIFE